MKSFTATGSDPDKPERFLGYMVPSIEEVNITTSIMLNDILSSAVG